VSQPRRKRPRGGQPGPRPLRTSEIPVVNSHGDRIKVYAREYREPLPQTETERKLVAYELSTGERVEILDKDTFVSARTGLKFVRIPA